MKNLAPMIYRQRLIVEGKCSEKITAKKIKEYMLKLSKILKMDTLTKPVTHESKKFGWAGWIHWEASGCHFYAWDKPFPFFNSDIYTCKKFSVKKAVKFTKEFFKAEKIEYKSV